MIPGFGKGFFQPGDLICIGLLLGVIYLRFNLTELSLAAGQPIATGGGRHRC